MIKTVRKGLDYLAIAVLIVLIFIAFSSDWLLEMLGKDVDIHLSDVNLPPGQSSSGLGTDYLGRDVLALLLNGAG